MTLLTSSYLAGVVQHGLPRPASRTVSICGARTNFRMPDVLSIGLGGGSYVCCSSASDDARVKLPTCTVGPQSVGSDLVHRQGLLSLRHVGAAASRLRSLRQVFVATCNSLLGRCLALG